MTSTATIDLRGILNSHDIFCPSYFCFKIFLYHRQMTNHKDYESPAHNSDICINYFIFIFQCILMYYYFRFIRLLNASNCSIITCSIMISFRCILYSILLLITSLFLLYTVHFYDNDLGMMAFLYLHVNSINIKGSFLNKFSIKCCTCPHVLMFFCSLLSFISVILLLLSGDIETNPDPDPDYFVNGI